MPKAVSGWGELPVPGTYIVTGICILAAVIGTIILCHFFYHFFKLNERNEKSLSKDKHQSQSTRSWIIQTMVLGFFSLWLYTYNRICVYTIIRTSTHCRIYMAFQLSFYLLSKNSMHSFFIRRLGDILQSTSVAYPQWQLRIFCYFTVLADIICCALIVFAVDGVIPVPTNVGGSFCVFPASNMYFWSFITLSGFKDIVYAVLTTVMLIKKLLILVQESLRLNIRQKSIQSIIATSPSSSSSVSPRANISPRHISAFHEESKHDNTLLLVCSKLVILNAFSCITSVLFLILITDVTEAGLQFDVFFNILIVWLNFKFASKWYEFFRCNYFTKWLFPILKTCALTSDVKAMCCASCCYNNDKDDIVQTHMEQHIEIQTNDTQTNILKIEMDDAENDIEIEYVYKRNYCSCCCGQAAQNLYILSSQEWDLYIND